MFSKKIGSLVLPLVVMLMLGACAAVPMATDEEDLRAKQMTPPAGKALIYVYRSESFGSAIKMPVTLDGRDAGETAAKTYFLFTVAPGPHKIVSKGEHNSELTVNAEPGKSHFVWQEIKMGLWTARSLLQTVDEATGRAAVKECKLIKGNL